MQLSEAFPRTESLSSKCQAKKLINYLSIGNALEDSSMQCSETTFCAGVNKSVAVIKSTGVNRSARVNKSTGVKKSAGAIKSAGNKACELRPFSGGCGMPDAGTDSYNLYHYKVIALNKIVKASVVICSLSGNSQCDKQNSQKIEDWIGQEGLSTF